MHRHPRKETGTSLRSHRHRRHQKPRSDRNRARPLRSAAVLLALAFAATAMGPSSALTLSSQLLKGKRVLVTGAGRGIGRAIALICHREGASVVVTARTESELKETVRLSRNEDENKNEEAGLRLAQASRAAELLSRRDRIPSPRGATPSPGRATSVGARRSGSATRARAGRSSLSRLTDAVRTGSASVAASNRNERCESNQDESESEHEPPGMVWYRCDVTDASEVDSVVRQILEEEGDIDVLVNNAGGSQSPKGPVGTLDGEDLESLLRLNVVGPNLVTSAVCKHSPSWKRMEAGEGEKVVLNVSSKAGKVGLENYSFYVATKFALEGLTSSWSKELARYGVRVHSISPGMVDTKSFPKPAGKKGVREASSIRECLLLALAGRIPPSPPEDGGDASDGKVIENMMDYTGHYIHVDEFDQVVREKGIGEAHLAWKPIDEAPFRV